MALIIDRRQGQAEQRSGHSCSGCIEACWATLTQVGCTASFETFDTLEAKNVTLEPLSEVFVVTGGDVAAGLALSSAVALFKGAAQGAAGQWAGDKSADFSPGEFQSELKTWGGSLATAALQQVSTAG